MLKTLRQTFTKFSEDECPRLAAALAYYAIFSLPALLVLVVAIASFFADREQVTGGLTSFFEDSLGKTGAQQMETMLVQSNQRGQGLWGTIVGFVMLGVGASGVLLELQTALNRAWGVEPDPKQGGVKTFIFKRGLSLAMVMGIAFLLLVSLVFSWLLGEFGSIVHQWVPAALSGGVLNVLDVLASLTIIALLFAAMLKFLPDVQLAWRDVWAGAVLSTVLFALGKYALSTYLSWSDVTSAYGAAGSLALVLLWIYYSAMIFFLGAEFTQVLTTNRGKRVAPEAGATASAAAKAT
ncbi:MAG: YihY/virulence factor BrkB family protein [Pirellulaceae bacterium]